MSAEIVNLRRVRKRMERRDDEARAESHRQLHGLTKAERDEIRQEREARDRTLDNSRRDTPGPDRSDGE